MTVDVRTAAILREFGKNDDGSGWLLFQNKTDSLDARVGLKAALKQAMQLRASEDSDMADVSEPVTHPKGAIVFVDNTSDMSSFPSMLVDVASELTASGYDGSIRTSSPDWAIVDDPSNVLASMSAIMRFDHTAGEEANLRSLVSTLVGWVTLPEAANYFGCQDVHFRANAADLVELVMAGLRSGQTTSITSQIDGDHMRRLCFPNQVDVLVEQRVTAAAMWPEDSLEVQNVLVSIADFGLSFGCVKRGRMGQFAWRQLGKVDWPSEPVVGSFAMIDHPEVPLHEFAPDVFGVQVLTDEHLAKLGHLDNWSAQEVAPRRYLVRHRNQVAWFNGSGPNPAALDAAREDFAPILITDSQVHAARVVTDSP